MKRTIEVFYDGEVLRAREPLALEPNARYRVTIEDLADGDASSMPAAVRRILDRATDLGLPSDLAAQHDHYLHGTPKR